MKRKIIEIFGLPGVGKTTFEIDLKNYLKSKNKIVLNRREIITKHGFSNIDNNLLDYVTLLYFRLIEKFKNKSKNNLKNNLKNNFNLKNYKKKIEFKNFISNFFRERYIKICERLFLKYFKNNLKNKKIIKNLIKKIDHKNKSLISFWIYEMFAAYYVFVQKRLNLIYLSDEGFNQRCFLILSSEIKQKKFFLNELYNVCPKPDLCIYLTRNIQTIKNVHKQRKLDQSGVILEKNKINNFIKFEKAIYNKFKNDIKFIKIKNYKKKSKLKKILK